MPDEGQIWANLVLAKNGTTTLNGSSRGLSSNEDRRRFHALRSQADAILIGGNTAASEPYDLGQKLTYVYSAKPLPQNLAGRPNIKLISPRLRGLSGLAADLRREHQLTLCEAGAKLLLALVSINQIDRIFITRSALDGDGPESFEIPSNFKLVERESVGEEYFEAYVRF